MRPRPTTTKLWRAEDGFTLPEVLMTTVILAVITASVGAAMITALRTHDRPARVLGPSNDANLLASYFTADVQSAADIDVDPSAESGCENDPSWDSRSLFALSWTDDAPDEPVSHEVSYRLDKSAGTISRVASTSEEEATITVVGRYITSACATVDTAAGAVKLDVVARDPDAAAEEPPFEFSLRAVGRIAGSGSGGASGPGSGAARLPTGEVTGTVKRYADEKENVFVGFLAGAKLTLTRSGGVEVQVTTGGDGRYYFGTLATGTYQLALAAPGYKPTGGASLTRTVSVTGATVTEKFGVWIPVGSVTVLARLGDPAGTPLAGVVVEVEGPTRGTDVTGSDGRYTFSQLALGDYTVRFTAPPGHEAVATELCRFTVSDGTAHECPDVVFHNGANEILGRVRVVSDLLAPTGDRSGAGGAGQGGVTVTLTGGPAPLVRVTESAADGTFSFPGLAAGQYTITQAVPAGYDPADVGSSSATRTLDGTTTPPVVDLINRPQCSLASKGGDLRVEQDDDDSVPSTRWVTVTVDRLCTGTVTMSFRPRTPTTATAAATTATTSTTAATATTAIPAVTATGLAAVTATAGPGDTYRGAVPAAVGPAAGEVQVDVSDGARLLGTVTVEVDQ